MREHPIEPAGISLEIVNCDPPMGGGGPVRGTTSSTELYASVTGGIYREIERRPERVTSSTSGSESEQEGHMTYDEQ